MSAAQSPTPINAAQAAILRKIAEAKSVGGDGAPYIQAGKYGFIVQSLVLLKGFKGNSFIITLYVKSSISIDPDIKPNAVDTTCATVYNLDDKNGYGVSDARNFMITLLGSEPKKTLTDPEGVEDLLATMTAAVGPLQPCRGMEIGDEAWLKVNKKDPNKPFTKNRWSHIPTTSEQVNANRRLMDGLETAKTV